MGVCPCGCADEKSIALDWAGCTDEIVRSGWRCVLEVMVCEVFNSDVQVAQGNLLTEGESSVEVYEIKVNAHIYQTLNRAGQECS